MCCPFRSLRTAIFRFSFSGSCHARLHVFRWFSGFDWFCVTISKSLCPEIQSYLRHTQCFSCDFIVIIILSFSYRCRYFSCAAGRGAGGGCYSFVYAIYVCRPKGLRRFGRSIDHFGLESGMVFEGTTGVYEGICRFNSKWIRNEEKFANSKRT